MSSGVDRNPTFQLKTKNNLANLQWDNKKLRYFENISFPGPLSNKFYSYPEKNDPVEPQTERNKPALTTERINFSAKETLMPLLRNRASFLHRKSLKTESLKISQSNFNFFKHKQSEIQKNRVVFLGE